MKCNIDQKGRVVRFFLGVLAFSVGVVLTVLGVVFDWGNWGWIMGGVVILAGMFSIYEAKKSWCVLRACGIKTWL
ncbi:hypothetical protein [Poriferisphaera sp. WC338]|uniref:hypothetical protein n=1 Tax=Poriferisphaera sp. WC338 TaxID=3425129 RepID=UPI003D813A69